MIPTWKCGLPTWAALLSRGHPADFGKLITDETEKRFEMFPARLGHENMKVAPIDAADVFCPLHAVGEANIKAD